MINLRTRKIIRDIWDYKMRSFLVVLTIAISVFSVGSLGRVWVILSRNLTNTYLDANPASASLTTAQTFTDSLITRVNRIPEVGSVEGTSSAYVRVQVGPDRWRTLLLIARSDYDNLTLDKVAPESGDWPPTENTILMERTSLTLLPLDVGDTITIELGNQQQEELLLAGSVYDVTQISSSFSLVAYGYVTLDTFQELTGRKGYTTLDFTVAEDPLNQDHIEQVVDQVTKVMESNGQLVTVKDVPIPGKHELDNIVASVLLLLAILSVLGMFLGVFLVINIISAQLAQQTEQIGTIKAVGGVSTQIVSMYIGLVLFFGLIAVVVSIPMAIVFSYLSSTFFAGLINFNIVSLDVPTRNLLLELGAGFLLPVLAALYPILKASRLTVRESIGFSGGQSVQFGTSGIEQLLNRIPNLPATILYPFRNIFRRKVRLALASITLSVAGAIWIAVAGVRASLDVTVDGVADYWQEDINVTLRGVQSYRQIERTVSAIDGVQYVEPRLTRSAFRVRPDTTESIDSIDVFGLLPDSPFIQPQIVEGRWLTPDDTDAVVVNIDLLGNEPDIAVGDTLTLKIGNLRTNWQVVGISTSQVIGGADLLNSPIAYVNYNQLTRVTRLPGQADRLLIGTRSGSIENVVSDLESQFAERGIGLASILPKTDVRSALDDSFSIVLSVLQITSLVYGFVGGLGLTSMMTLNVLERTREIGIIRSVGGIRAQLSQIIVTEGVFVGVISWFFATAIAYPLSIALGNAVGRTLLRTALTPAFPWSGPLLWLGLVVVLSIISSLIPGRNAARLSVRETISFE